MTSEPRRATKKKEEKKKTKKPANNVWSLLLFFFFTQLTTNQFWGLFRGKTHGFGVREGVGKKATKRSAVRKRGWKEGRFMCSLCPSLSVFTAAAQGASLPLDQVSGGPHRCAAVSSAVINIRNGPRLSRGQPIASEKRAMCSQHPCAGWLRGPVTHRAGEPALIRVFVCWR